MMKDNKKILEYKKIIKEQKKKIRLEKKSIRKKKREKYRKSKFGKTIFGKFFGILFFAFDDRDTYSFSEVFGTTIVSLVFGFLVCLSLFVLLSGGRNFFRMNHELGKIYDVYNVLLKNYNGDLSKDKLVEEAIDGMVSSVGDVYTSYNNVKATEDFSQLVSGTYEGIGCTIQKVDEGIKIAEIYDNTPASKAGLLAGDIIISVDDKKAKDETTDTLSSYIRNDAKGKIKIVVLRDKEEKTFTLERSTVEIPSVVTKVLSSNDKKIGYIGISLFSSVTAKQFEKELKEVEEEKIDGLIIDVRGNSGGYLTSVTDIASMFLPKGAILYQVQNGKKKEITKDKTAEKRTYPIAVLVNGGSASASEILAASIKESYNGFVVGTKTYGKGTVQQVKKLTDGSMIKYTTQNWLTPDGNWINEVGIEPTDLVVMNKEYYENPSDEADNQLQKALELVSK